MAGTSQLGLKLQEDIILPSNFFVPTGPLNVTTGILPWSAFGKFFDFFEHSNYMPRPDNKHYAPFSLKRTLKQFADFPIKTKEGEPRFLLVAVDAQTGDAVTFDCADRYVKIIDPAITKQCVPIPAGFPLDSLSTYQKSSKE